jgi:hypothetical protein
MIESSCLVAIATWIERRQVFARLLGRAGSRGAKYRDGRRAAMVLAGAIEPYRAGFKPIAQEQAQARPYDDGFLAARANL